jgi:hypothetical protein
VAAVPGRRNQQLWRIAGLGQVGDRPVAAVGQQRPRPHPDPGGRQGRRGRGHHRSQLLQVAGVLGEFGRHDHLRRGGDRLGVVALHPAVAGVHHAAVGVGDVGGRLRLGRLVSASRPDAGPGLLALGPGRGGQLGDPLLIPPLALGRVGFQQRLGLLQPGQPAGLAGQLGRELVAARRAVLVVLGPVGLGGLPQDLGNLRLELGQGAVGPIGSVGRDLGAVQRDHT